MTAVPPVISSIPVEAGEPTDVAFILRMVTGAYDASYPPDVLFGPASPPILNSLTPNSIEVDTPTLIDIDGTGFRPDSHVFVDDVQQPSVFVSPTHMRYTAEASAEGTQDVEVQTEGLASNVLVLDVTAAAPLVAEEQSSSPPAAPGDVPPPEAPPDSGGGVTGGRRPRNGNGGKRQT